MADVPQYILGYGSLVEAKSRAMTWPSAIYASPVVVKGIRRGWFDRVETVGYTTTYLGAVADPNSACNGVIFSISPEGLIAYNKRESGYIPTKIPQAAITMLDGTAAAPQGDIWYYASKHELKATPEIPIVQSYVDVCLNGCLEIEATYPLARSIKHKNQTMSFSQMFIDTCSDWSDWWVNDRLYPRRPFVYVPNAYTIDTLIKKYVGKDPRQIPLEPAPWESATS
jgi:hypothetical protein